MKQHLPSLLLLAACNVDSPPPGYHEIPFEISVEGQAAEVSYAGLAPLAYLDIAVFERNDDVTPVAQTTTDMLGNYRVVITTDGETPFEGYLRARKPGFMDTYLYLAKPLDDSYANAPLRMISPDTFDLLGDVCAANQLPSNGMIASIVTDYGKAPLTDATVTSTPSSNKYCYNGAMGYPDSVRLTTGADGVAYMFNVTGPVTVTASSGKLAFHPRNVTARAGVVTLVLLAPY